MINFRFHLVSLIAVFLALALGVVVGSTVIDRAIVDGLEAQIDRVERNAENVRQENSELNQRLEQLAVLVDQAAPFTVDARLEGVPVVVLGVRGIDEAATRGIIEAVRAADAAAAPAILWLEQSWALVDKDDVDQMRALLDRPAARADVLRRSALDLFAARLAAGTFAPADVDDADPAPDDDGAPDEPGDAQPGTTTTAPGEGADDPGVDDPGTDEEPATTTTSVPVELPEFDVLAELVDAGFVSVDTAGGETFDVGTYPGAGARVVLADGAAAHVSAESLFVPFLADLVEFGVPTVAAEVPADEEDRAVVVGLVRNDDDLSEAVSTVDSADDVAGRMAVVLALQNLGEGQVGHYGLGPGASRQLPEPIQD